MYEYKGVKYWLNYYKEWFYSNSLKTPLKPLKAKTYESAKKEVEKKIDNVIKQKK